MQTQVKIFTTEPLANPVEWTGHVRTELYVSSSARDSDFIVRVSDVYPDGRSILIADYVLRARYREGFEKEVFMEADKVHKVAFHVQTAYKKPWDEIGDKATQFPEYPPHA